MSLMGIAYSLDVQPERLSGCFFPCPQCRKTVFDGGIPKVCLCECGLHSLRDENLAITTCSAPRIDSFYEKFRVRVQTPPSSSIPVLSTVTFGLFESQSDPDTALRSTLLPFTLYRERCYGVNDLLEVSGLRFKVLASEPPYGVARKATKVQCYTLLHTGPVSRLKVAAVYPLAISQRLVDTVVLPYLRTPFLHIHHSKSHFRPVYIYIGRTVRGGGHYAVFWLLGAGNNHRNGPQAFGRSPFRSVPSQSRLFAV